MSERSGGLPQYDQLLAADAYWADARPLPQVPRSAQLVDRLIGPLDRSAVAERTQSAAQGLVVAEAAEIEPGSPLDTVPLTSLSLLRVLVDSRLSTPGRRAYEPDYMHALGPNEFNRATNEAEAKMLRPLGSLAVHRSRQYAVPSLDCTVMRRMGYGRWGTGGRQLVVVTGSRHSGNVPLTEPLLRLPQSVVVGTAYVQPAAEGRVRHLKVIRAQHIRFYGESAPEGGPYGALGHSHEVM